MGILIQFPQPDTRTPPGKPLSNQRKPQDLRAAAYRRDLDRAVTLLLEHVESDVYDGIALILKPRLPAHKPALVVGGFYRHRLTEGANAAMQLHLAIKLRAGEQSSEPPHGDTLSSHRHPQNGQEDAIGHDMQDATAAVDAAHDGKPPSI